MNIVEATNRPKGSPVDFFAVLGAIAEKTKRNGESYLEVSVQDSSGVLTFPLWEGHKNLVGKEGSVIRVTGQVDSYNGTPQVSRPTVNLVEDSSSFDLSAFVPSYNIPQEVLDDFKDIVMSMEDPYRKIALYVLGNFDPEELNYQEFIKMPAAVKWHGNKMGGGLLHIYGVLKNTQYIYGRYVENPFFQYHPSPEEIVVKDRLFLKAILHDWGKTREYAVVPCVSRVSGNIDHRVLGVAMLAEANIACGDILSETDLNSLYESIQNHHGKYGQGERPLCSAEDKIIHAADMVDSQIVVHLERNVAEILER